MHKGFWKERAAKGPIVALAPMDGYCDSPFRQVVKKIAPETVVFSEFYSADGLVHSKELQRKALTHDPGEYPLIIQIFGKDPDKFAEAAKIIEAYGITGIDINMGCPAKKVVSSGHGSSLMINRDTAFRIVEKMSEAVNIPISVKTRLGWENHDLLIDFCRGLENAGANLITVHGRTYKQAFTGRANFEGIYELKQHLTVPVMGNGDVRSYEDGLQKIIHPLNRAGDSRYKDTGTPFPTLQDGWNKEIGALESSIPGEVKTYKNLDGFMIGRASFGNPWCFFPDGYTPTLREILATMKLHGELLWQWKERKGVLEARKHLVQYLHGFRGVKEYRSALVHVESLEDIETVIEQISREHKDLLDAHLETNDDSSQMGVWIKGGG